MIGFIRNVNPLYRAEFVSVLVSTIMYGIILYMTGNFKSAALASSIVVVIIASSILTKVAIVAAFGALAAIAIAIIIALAAASITTGAILAVAPVPTPTPPPAVIAAFAVLIIALFAGIAFFYTTRLAAKIHVPQTRAIISTFIEIVAILAAYYTLSHIFL